MVWGELDAQRRPPVDDDGVPVDVTLDRPAVHGRPETALSLQIGRVEHDGGPHDVHGPHATTHLRQKQRHRLPKEPVALFVQLSYASASLLDVSIDPVEGLRNGLLPVAVDASDLVRVGGRRPALVLGPVVDDVLLAVPEAGRDAGCIGGTECGRLSDDRTY